MRTDTLDALVLQSFCDHDNVSLSLFYGHSWRYNRTYKIKIDKSRTNLFILEVSFIYLKNFVSEIVLNNVDHFITLKLKPKDTEHCPKK